MKQNLLLWISGIISKFLNKKEIFEMHVLGANGLNYPKQIHLVTAFFECSFQYGLKS